jgi:hypothetical protein
MHDQMARAAFQQTLRYRNRAVTVRVSFDYSKYPGLFTHKLPERIEIKGNRIQINFCPGDNAFQ